MRKSKPEKFPDVPVFQNSNFLWCRRGDLNPHEPNCSLDPESSASTNSATSAFETG